jgi:protein phosphatase
MEIWGITDKGAVRQSNQDVFMTLRAESRGIAVLCVCDGMGGANAGDVASATAAERFMESVRAYLDEGAALDGEQTCRRLTLAVSTAGNAVYEIAMNDPDCAGMGTTLVAAISSPNGEYVVNVGDSRAYVIDAQGILQITKDHSVVEEMIDRGEIDRDEARTHPSKNLITRALGTSRGEQPDIFELDMDYGDYLLLCSDGLSNLLSEDDILLEVRSGGTVTEMCENMVTQAMSRGAPDNVTAVLFRK